MTTTSVFIVKKRLLQRRFLLGRRFGRGWLLIAVVLVAATFASVFFTLPYLARARVTTTLGSKLGAEVAIDEMSVGLLSIAFQNIRIKAPNEKGTALDIEKLVSRANVFNLLLNGINAINAIELHGLNGTLNLQDRYVMSMRDRLLSTKGVSRGDSRSNRKIALSIKDVSLIVRDRDRELISLKGNSIRYIDGLVATDFGSIHLGSEPDAVLELTDVRVNAGRDDRRFKLQSAIIGSARIALPEQTTWLPESVEDAKAASPAANDKRKKSVSAVGTQSSSRKSPDESVSSGDSGKYDQDEPREKAETGTFTRLLNAFRSLRRGQKTQTEEGQPKDKQTTQGSKSIYDWLTTEVTIELRNASVGIRSQEGLRVILKELHGKAVGQTGGGFHLIGKGNARDGGSVHWDMKVWPDELRADGRVALESLPLTIIAPLLPEVPWHMPEQSRVDARLELSTQSVERLAVSGRAQVANAALFLPRIAPHPITDINFAIQGNGHFFPLKRRLEIDQAMIELAKAVSSLSGALEWSSDHYLFDIDARLPVTDCQIAVGAIPRDLLEELVGFQWRGSMQGAFRLQIDSRDLDNTVMKIDVEDRCEFTMVPSLADLRRFRMPFIHYVLEPDGSELEFETGPGTRNWTYLEEVSPFLVHAVLSHEDVQFFQHAGFSPAHIRNALVRNLREGRYAVGASTITMQLVKNLFLKREKTLARKVQEVLLTWWVERVMEKRDILELYLNVIEYGPGIYGIRNGARHYFNRLPSELSPAESIYLSMILPNPKRYHNQFERGSISSSWKDRMAQALRRMGDRGWYTQDAMQYGLEEIESFHFYPDGKAVPSRTIPGRTSPLPYMEAFDKEWDWAEKALGRKSNDRGSAIETKKQLDQPKPQKGTE
jgi:hypothetical protein